MAGITLNMKTSVACLALLLVWLAGCGTSPKPAQKVPEAPKAVQPAAVPAPALEPSVFFTGNVRNPVVPFTEGLTLSRAYLLAGYQGGSVPALIAVMRQGQAAVMVETRTLFRGQDMLLEAGDRIEIRP
jgi:hypothetical protein